MMDKWIYYCRDCRSYVHTTASYFLGMLPNFPPSTVRCKHCGGTARYVETTYH